ncbi:MAG: T9SS type A sorting domain-containing protein, partial [Phaeodactylibacter sp.]|nr:T9SS type A sorting domain-containing protein [Phaeodactylibacter sp.]
VDCDDNDPNATTQPGDACDDGNPATINDMVDANCGCAGTLNSCPGIGDNDGDGICADVDCDDNNPNITTQQGDACDDGNPNTVGETIQGDCSCGGGNSAPTQTCAMVSESSDDAEEQGGPADLTSSDLELATDPNLGSQTVGIRFTGLNIPQGAVITSAYVQFTVDETDNGEACSLNIYGQAADNALTFASVLNDISGRPKTTATVNWAPPAWLGVGDAGPAQQTPDLSAIIQEIVNRGGYTSNSAIALIINGTGNRTAESINGSLNGAPELCVEYLYAAVANRTAAPTTPNTTVVEGTGIEQPAASPFVENPLPDEGYLISPISVHPNPASTKLNASFRSKMEGAVQIQIRDLNGKIMLQEMRVVEKGDNAFLLKDLSLPSGVYILQMFADDTVQSAKFVISND